MSETTTDETTTDETAELDDDVSRETDPSDRVSRETDEDATEDDENDDDDSFPRAYVEQLRGKQRRYRERAQTAEQRAGELTAALWRAQVAGLDRLADPDDLPLPEDGDPLDPDAVAAAVDELLTLKPHLAARRARGDVGQHDRREADESVSLAAMLRANA